MKISDLKSYTVTNTSSVKPITSSTQEQSVKKPMPLLTNEQGGVGTALKDVALGAGKSFIRGGRDLAGMVQGLGQKTAGLFGVNTTGSGIKSITDTTAEGSQVGEQLKSKSRGEQIGGLLETGAELASGFTAAKGPQAIAKAKQAYTAGKEAKAGDKILETISPKPTVKEARLAQSQGRLIQGKERTFFKAGTEDKIAPTEKLKQAKDIIIQRIPNATKLNPKQLYTAVDSEITNTATKLRPQMEATPIKPETIGKINTDWEKLKKIQLEAADATEEANVAKLQKQFEAKLQKSGSGNHADLWDTRIEYDNSIPKNVKEANAMSSESLQNKKEIWLQNRQILSDAINDVEHGMGELASKPFKEMSNLYEAKNNLLSKAKVDKAQVSKLKELVQKNPEVASLLKAGLGIELFTRLFGGN